jgi:hypothetical protein
MDPNNLVKQTIDCLTDDEDHRQNLWIHYLNGNNLESLSYHLEKIKKDSAALVELENKLLNIVSSGYYTKIQGTLTNFTEYEQSIMCLLILGLSAHQIADIKGISEVRIRQTILTIRYNPYWDNLYGSEKELNRRRKARSDRGRDKTGH